MYFKERTRDYEYASASDKLQMNMEINDIEEMVKGLENSKFPKSGKALNFFIFKMNFINTSIIRCCEIKDYYSTCILFRSLLEHYFKYLYVYTRALRESNDNVGEEYYGELNGYEDFTYMRSMQNLRKKLTKKVSILTLDDKDNEALLKAGTNFGIKSILAFLNEGIKDDLKLPFELFFTDYCKKYYDLSSFVHGGPFAEKYMKKYSDDKESMDKDLEYFVSESEALTSRVVQNTKMFFDITKK